MVPSHIIPKVPISEETKKAQQINDKLRSELLDLIQQMEEQMNRHK